MGPDGGLRYHGHDHWSPGHGMHHGPPGWIDGTDVFLPLLLSALFPLLLLMWVLSRWLLLDALAARARNAPATPRGGQHGR